MRSLVLDIYQSDRITDRVIRRQQRWRWRLIAGNNRKVASGGEGYTNYRDAYDAALSVIDPDGRVELKSGGVLRPGVNVD